MIWISLESFVRKLSTRPTLVEGSLAQVPARNTEKHDRYQ